MASRSTSYLYCHELSNILRYCHNWQNCVAAATQYAQHIIQNFRQEAGSKRLILGCIVAYIYMALERLLTYIATNYQIFFDIATTEQNRVAPATQYAQHIIQNFRQEAGSKRLILGCIVYRPIYMASRKTPSTYIATNHQIFFDIATTGRIAWRWPRNTLSI